VLKVPLSTSQTAVLIVIAESRSVMANSRAAAAQRCLYRLTHLVGQPCHAEKTEITEPLRSVNSRCVLLIGGTVRDPGS